MKRKIAIVLIIALFAIFAFYNKTSLQNLARADSLNNVGSSAQSMIVMETANNTVLYHKNEFEKLPMASTTKIVTAITVIENCDDLTRLIEVPKKATYVEGSSIYLKAGEKLSIEQLLYGLMLQSGNDAAMTLAFEFGQGSIENFAKMMNETAKKCGAEDSNFVTPHGLDDKNHYTTAFDLAKITSYALKNPTFKTIVSTKVYNVPASPDCTARTLVNKNKLLTSLDGCIGVKTGYTSKSGRCLVSACERNGMQVVCVVLNCRPMFEESFNLINKAFEEYSVYEILPEYKFIDNISVQDGKTPFIKLYNKNGFKVVAKKDEVGRYTLIYDYPDSIKAPIKKDEVFGSAKVYYDNTLIFNENLCSIEQVDSIDTTDQIKNILDKW